MSRIVLDGLVGSNPLGALASFGLLRILSHSDLSARLSFVERDDFIAVIDTQHESRDALVAWLQTWICAHKPSVLNAFEEDLRVAPIRYQEMIERALNGVEENLELASYLIALAASGAQDKSKGLIKPSPFYMASGQQSFIDTMNKIHERVRQQDLWSEALFGPWRYETNEWGAGWDPSTERLHALRFKAPTKDKTACIAGAVWLGFEALPLFPSFSRRGSATAVGWLEGGRYYCWRWLLPAVSVSIDTLAVLLGSSELKDQKQPKREGVLAIYESTRHEFGQGYAVFRPARRIR